MRHTATSLLLLLSVLLAPLTAAWTAGCVEQHEKSCCCGGCYPSAGCDCAAPFDSPPAPPPEPASQHRCAEQFSAPVESSREGSLALTPEVVEVPFFVFSGGSEERYLKERSFRC